MDRKILYLIVFALGLFAPMLIGAVNISGSKCAQPISVTSGFDQYYSVGASSVDELEISFEPDGAAGATTATVTLSFCSRDAVAASCQAYNYDSTGDGIEDDNILDGTTTARSGLKNISGFRYLRVEDGTPPGASDEAEITICRREY